MIFKQGNKLGLILEKVNVRVRFIIFVWLSTFLVFLKFKNG